MTALDERYPDLLTGDRDPELELIVSKLDTLARAGMTSTIPRDRDQTIMEALHDRAVAATQPTGTRRGRLVKAIERSRYQSGSLRRRALALGAAAAIVLTGAGTYIHMQAPTPVSAAQILHRAAAAMQVGPDQVVHEDSAYSIVVQPTDAPRGSSAITYQQWSQPSSNGGTARAAVRWDDGTNTGGIVADENGILWQYDSASHSVYKSTWTPGTALFGTPSHDSLFLLKATVLTPQDPGGIRELIQSAQSGSDTQIQLLPQQTIDGRQVDVVQMTRSLATGDNGVTVAKPAPGATNEIITVSIDDSTYLIRSIDERSTDDQGKTLSEDRLQVTQYDILPASQAPEGVFTFTPPAGWQINPDQK